MHTTPGQSFVILGYKSLGFSPLRWVREFGSMWAVVSGVAGNCDDTRNTGLLLRNFLEVYSNGGTILISIYAHCGNFIQVP